MEIDANKDNYQQTAEKERGRKRANGISAKRTKLACGYSIAEWINGDYGCGAVSTVHQLYKEERASATIEVTLTFSHNEIRLFYLLTLNSIGFASAEDVD